MPSGEIAILLGGVANLLLGALRVLALIAIANPKVSLPIRVQAGRESLVLMTYRQIVMFVAFGAISLAFPTEIATTSLGIALAGLISLFLLLKVVEQVTVPEIRRQRDYAGTLIAAAGGAAYLFVVTRGI